MNTDIRVDVGFLSHWKTEALIAECGADGVLSLINLWVFTAQNKPNGLLSGVEPRIIERIAKWRGEPGRFLATISELRFIEQGDDGVCRIHDWERHNPYAASAEARHERAKKANEVRRSSTKAKNEHATSTLQARSEHATSTLQARSEHAHSAPLPSPSPSPSPSPFPFSFPPTPLSSEAAPTPSASEPKKEKKGGGDGEGSKIRMTPAWMPRPSTLDAFPVLGIPIEWAMAELVHFRLHHIESATEAIGFDSLFVGWVKRAWRNRPPPNPADDGSRRKGETLVEHAERLRRMNLARERMDAPMVCSLPIIGMLENEAGERDRPH